jgi:hypothetical protein
MHHEKQVVIKGEDDALADAADTANGLALDGCDRGIDRAQNEGTEEIEALEAPSDDVPAQRFEVDNDIRQLRQSANDRRLTTND